MPDRNSEKTHPYCTNTEGGECAAQKLVSARDLNNHRAQELRQSVQKARENLDVSDYSGLEATASGYEARANKLQRKINSAACDLCPFRS